MLLYGYGITYQYYHHLPLIDNPELPPVTPSCDTRMSNSSNANEGSSARPILFNAGPYDSLNDVYEALKCELKHRVVISIMIRSVTRTWWSHGRLPWWHTWVRKVQILSIHHRIHQNSIRCSSHACAFVFSDTKNSESAAVCAMRPSLMLLISL